jgi:hypothetical protein
MAGKLILPKEIKVCATCSYWEGERRVDADVDVVVIDEDCLGECMVRGQPRSAMHPVLPGRECLWEDLTPDEVGEEKAA